MNSGFFVYLSALVLSGCTTFFPFFARRVETSRFVMLPRWDSFIVEDFYCTPYYHGFRFSTNKLPTFRPCFILI